MKRIIVLVVTFFFIAGIISICFIINNRRKNALLFINNKLIEGYLPQIKGKQSYYSLIGIFKAFGYSVEADKDKTILTKDTQRLIISQKKQTMVVEGSEFNLLSFPPGTRNGYKVFKNNDVYVDDDLLRNIFSELGAHITIQIQDANVYINLR